ncbi:MAG: type IV secretory system conjugative DNA transfer family protein [Bacilli bacterium]|nr:type IV secretory system conjugative DNA transfer family protein [Bacilli bacterium]
MKLKFRVDPDDLLIFVLFCIFLFYIVCIAVANVHCFATEGHLSGLNPFLAFAPDVIGSTLVLYLVAFLGLFASVNSMFFEREKGFGLTTTKKDKGYSRWAKDKEIKEELTMVPIQQRNSKAAGVPLILNDKEMWVDNGEYHSLVIGATGSGKTQTVILPTVHSLAKARESMIITDPKGEIYEKTSNMLRARGYQILLLNFRDPQNGNAWNPMSLPYRMYKSGNQDKAIELLDDLALNILYDESNKNADPFWEKTSADYFSGVALGLFEDAQPNEININSISLATTVGEEKFGGSTYIKEYFAGKDPNSAASINASSTIMAPSETKGSILSVFKQKVKLFASRENLSEMLSYSDINLESIGEKPTAVFIVIQDEKKTYHSLVTILLKQIYETLISVAQRHGGKLPIRTNFLLDEFPNMPPLKDVTTMITAARSRNIRFTMIIQNFAQLDDVYGKEEAETIRGNCGNIIYLITTELKALEEISKMCGEEKSKKDDKTASTPLVTVSDLQRMKQFEVIILRMRKQPFKTKFTPYFKIDWGKKYPPAKYPTRPKRELHTFDIKEFVKTQKKKKLLEMMNAADQEDKANGLPMALPRMNRVHEELPPELQQIRERRKQEAAIPDFLQRRPVEEKEKLTEKKESRVPSFEEFRRQMEEADSFNPFEEHIEVPMKKEPSIPERLEDDDDDDDGDDLGFDVDELVRKIDAKIAELEKEEQRNKEIEEQRKQENQKESVKEIEPIVEEETVEELDGVSTTEDKPYNSIENIHEEEKKKPEVLDDIKPLPNISLDDDDDDEDDFFDDFFDN